MKSYLFEGIGDVEKVFIDKTNLMHALISVNPNIETQRETFFFNQMRVNNDVMTSKTWDFRINDHIFEAGGKNKNCLNYRIATKLLSTTTSAVFPTPN